MTSPAQENQATTEVKSNDKEINFRKQEQMYQRMLAEKEARMKELEQQLQQRQQSTQSDDDDQDDEPYVDKKKLNKSLQKFDQSTKSEIQKAMEAAKLAAKEELKQELWLESNPDFYDVLEHANKFAEKAPKLAETILRMPEGFERQKLVYQNIKALGIDKPEQPKSSIQDKIEANKRSPYYQPSGIPNAPYAGAGDFSPAGQKNAFEQMQKLKANLRL